MVEAGEGVIIATGNTSAVRGKPRFAGFASTKAAQRILAEAIARELGPKGVHVAYVWHVAHQDRSAWSFNVEIRPFAEAW